MPEDLILSPEDRTRLDGIVSEMISNGESDDFIQNVVNDYKSKYSKKKDSTESSSASEPSATRSDSWFRRNIGSTVISLGTGAEATAGGLLKATDLFNTTSFSYLLGDEGEKVRQLVEQGVIENKKFIEPVGELGEAILEDSQKRQIDNLLTAGYTMDEIETGFLGSMMEGNYAGGLGLLGHTMVQQIPQLALAASTGGSTGLALLGTSAAGSAYNEVENNPLYTESERMSYAVLMGAAEFAAEKIFAGDINMIRKAFGKEPIDQAIKQNLFASIPKGLKSALEEGTEEALVSIVDQVTRSAIEGESKFDAMEIAESMIVGSLMGGSIYGITKSIGAQGTSETMEQRKTLDELDGELKTKLEDPSISEEEREILKKGREEIAKKKAAIIEQDAEFYSQFSEEDVKKVAEIDGRIGAKIKKLKKVESKEAKALITSEINELISQKLEIENKYRETAGQPVEETPAEVPAEKPVVEAPVEAAPVEEVTKDDSKEETGVPSPVQEGEAPIEAEPVAQPSEEAPETGGDVQAVEEVTPASEAEIEQPTPPAEAEEVTAEERDIADAEFKIEDLQSEIDIEKDNIRESKEKAKKDIAKVKAGKLSKNRKAAKIEQIKAELQDTVDEFNGNIEIYRDDIKGLKSDIRKAKRKLEKAKATAPAPVEAKPAKPKKKSKKKPQPKKTKEAAKKKIPASLTELAKRYIDLINSEQVSDAMALTPSERTSAQSALLGRVTRLSKKLNRESKKEGIDANEVLNAIRDTATKAKAPAPVAEEVEATEPPAEGFPSVKQVKSINATVDSRQNTHTVKLVETTEDGKEIIYDAEVFRNPRAGEVTFSIAKRVPGKEARVRTYKDFTAFRKQVNRIAAKENVREDVDFKLRTESRMQAESTRKDRDVSIIDTTIEDMQALSTEEINAMRAAGASNEKISRRARLVRNRSVTLKTKQGVVLEYRVTNIPGQKHLGYGILKSGNRRTVFPTREQYEDAIKSIIFIEGVENISEEGFSEYWKDYITEEAVAKRDQDAANKRALDAIAEAEGEFNEKGVSLEELAARADAAKDIIQFIAPGTDILFTKDQAEFDAKMDEVSSKGRSSKDGREQARMVYNRKNGRRQIYINLQNSNLHTIAHEVFHAYFDHRFNQDPMIAKDLAKKVYGVLKSVNKKEAESMRRFIEQYDPEVQSEEFLAEFGARLSEMPNLLEKSTLQKLATAIRDFLVNLAGKLGVKSDIINSMKVDMEFEKSATEAVEFIKGFAGMMRGANDASYYQNYPIPTVAKQEDIKFKGIFGERSSLDNASYTAENGLVYEYTQDKEMAKKMISTGHKIEEFFDSPVMIHTPDNAFSGNILDENGNVIVEGKGGVFYPIHFAEFGYVWASTDTAAQGMANRINDMIKMSGVARIMINAGPQDKLLSSTVNANGLIDILYHMSDNNGLFSRRALDKVIGDVAYELHGSLVKDVEAGIKEIEKDQAKLAKKGKKLSSKDSAKLTHYKKSLEKLEGIKVTKSTKAEDKISMLRSMLGADISTFDQRKKLFSENLIRKISKRIGKNETFVNRVSEYLDIDPHHKGISKKSLTAAITEILTEPMVRGVEPGMAHTVIEVTEEVEAVRTSPTKDGGRGHHESYPMAIKTKSGNPVSIKIMDGPYNWFAYPVHDLSKGTEFAPEDTTDSSNLEDKAHAEWKTNLRAGTVLPSTSGISQVVIINGKPETVKNLEKKYRTLNPQRVKYIEEKIEEYKEKEEYWSDIKNFYTATEVRGQDIHMIIKDLAVEIAIENGVPKTKAEGVEWKNYIESAKDRYDRIINSTERLYEQAIRDSRASKERSSIEVPPRENSKQTIRERARKGVWPMIQSMAKNFSGYTENQKKARTYVEAMESQNNTAQEDVRKLAKALSKLLTTRESMEIANEYLTNPDDRDVLALQLQAMPNGERIVAILDGVRSYIDNLSVDILNSPGINLPVGKNYKGVRKMESYKEGSKKIYEVYDINSGETLYSKMTQEEAQSIADSNTLRDIIEQNIGSYMTTSYRFFKSDKYQITDDIRNAAVREEYEFAKLRKIKALVESGVDEATAVEFVSSPDVQAQTMQEAADSIDEYIRDIEALRGDKGYVFSGISASGLKVPKTKFQRKKDIPDHIQKLLGKEGDPITRFIDTAIALSNMKYRGQMISGIAQAFGSDIIKDEVTRGEKGSGQWKLIDDPYSYLNGKWVHAELAEMLDRKPLMQSDIPVIDGYFKILKLARKSKVVWNLPTWRKNLTGGWFFIAANGYVNPQFYKDLKARKDRMTKGEADPEIEALIKEMATVGLIGADVRANLIDVSDASINMIVDPDEAAAQSLLTKVWNKARKLDQRAGEKYASVDDYTKLIIYRKEKEVFSQKLYGKEYAQLTETQQKKVREEAAEYVKQNTPTFSRLPKWHKTLARIPFGDFISFKLEAYRSIYNNATNALRDIDKARKDDSLSEAQKKAYAKAGYSRLMGTVTTLGARAVVPGLLSAMMLGDDDQELAEAAKKLRANWMEGHSLIVSDIDKDGNITFYDYSMEDPYGEVTDLMINPADGFSQLKDSLSPNMVLKMVVNLFEGKDAYGYDIVDQMDPIYTKIWKYMNYTAKSVVYPPFVSSTYRDFIKKQDKGFYEEAGDFGVNLGKRSIIRDYKINANKQFYYMTREYKFGEPYYKLEGRRKENRLAVLDELRESYMAIQAISTAKGNPKLLIDANKSLSRFNKIERLYIKTGKQIGQ